MNQGATYRNTNWTLAVTYYEKAYTVANNAYYHCNGKQNKGMQEAANFYKAYATLIKNVINNKESSAYETNTYTTAHSKYKNILQEYLADLNAVFDIVDTFPTKLY